MLFRSSGGGIPGIPLALANPDKDFILLDPNGKKTRFMTQAKIELGLDNVEVIQSRIEDFEGQFDHVILRAVAGLSRIVSLVEHIVAPDGTVLAMKGSEVESLETDAMKVLETASIEVPFLVGERRLVILGRQGSP